jgi:hypothetical protein
MNPIYECIAQTLDASQARVVIIFSQAMYVLLCFRKPIVCAMHSYISFMNMSKNDEGIARKMDRQTRQKRPTTVSKETYYSVKIDLIQCASHGRWTGRRAVRMLLLFMCYVLLSY